MEDGNYGIPQDGASAVSDSIQSEQVLGTALDDKAAVEAAGEESQEQDTDQFASKFAALSRKEKLVRERESKIEAQIAEIEKKYAELEERSQPKVEEEPAELPLEYRLKQNPLQALEEMGLSYDKLTQLALNDGKLTADMQMDLMKSDLEKKHESQIEELRNEILEDKKGREEQKYNEVIENFMEDLTDFVNTDESYELIKAYDAVDVVFDVIEKHYQDTNKVLPNKEAADIVESHLKEDYKRIQSRVNKVEGITEVREPELQKRQSSPTLSNAHSAQVSTPADRKLSMDDSKASAASLLRWDD